MLQRERQKKYFLKYWKEMISNLEKFAKSGDDEALHQFRVQIKKINALLYFYAGKKYKNIRKPLRDIFMQAGTIRTASLQMTLLNKYRVDDSSLMREQYDLFSRQSNAFRSSFKEYQQALKEIKNKLAEKFKDINDEEVLLIFQNKTKEIIQTLKALRGNPEALHLARKNIKQMLYAHHVLGKKLSKLLSLQVDYLDHLQQQIGKWHDLKVAGDALKITKEHTPALAKIETSTKKLLETALATAKDFQKKSTIKTVGNAPLH